MPSFTIYQIGHPDRHLLLNKPELLIGREEGSDIQLNEILVSRRHALIKQQKGKSYTIEALAEKNPTVVNSRIIKKATPLDDGDEIQVGCFLLIFSSYEREGAENRQIVSYHAKCAACQKWEGTIAMLKSQPVCPSCGSARLIRGGVVQTISKDEEKDTKTAAPKKPVVEGATKCLNVDDVLAYQERVKRASMAYLTRQPEGIRVKLHSEKPNLLAKESRKPTIVLKGFLAGFGQAEIVWKGTGFMVQSNLTFAGMKVNGTSTRESRLKHGDKIEIGPNQFVFEVVDEG